MIRPLPKRIARIAPIGSLLKHAFDHGPQRRSIETPADPAYLEMIRQLPCIKCGVVHFVKPNHVTK